MNCRVQPSSQAAQADTPRHPLINLDLACPRIHELAMDRREARALLEATGVGLSDADVTELLGRTEGWPVGLYLAALARKAGSPGATSGSRSPGTTGSSPITCARSCWRTSRRSWWRS